MKENLKLSNRLLSCAEMIKEGSKIADIGTDHAYIPIWLAINKKIPYALACDISQGPLNNAQKNINKYNLENIIETRISDGLLNIKENEADEIIIAGLGGNVISTILEQCTWKNKKDKTFILQPMKYEERLREYLYKNKYEILLERAVLCSNKVYSVMKVKFKDKISDIPDYQKYIGKMERNSESPAAQAYIRKQIKNLSNHKKGAEKRNQTDLEQYYTNIIEKLKSFLKS